jgi:LPS export ABC transporter permease LptF/LPS export ABC transporter permease LptG
MGLRRLKPTLLDRYVCAEILPPTGLGLLLFTFILLLQQITLLTGILIARGADLSTILRLFLNILPSILAITIPMAFLLGVLLAFGRLASESEIVALRASGVSPAQLLRPVVALSAAAGLLTFYVLAVAVPRANQTYRQVFYALVLSKAKTGVKPRVFNDELIPGMVLYVSDIPAATGDWQNLFIADARSPGKPQVILAQSGRLVISERARSVELHLEHGVIHAYQPQLPERYEITRFRTWDSPLPFEQFFPQLPLSKGDRELTLPELLARIRELARAGRQEETAPFRVEVHKKFAIPAACLVFGLLGLGLSLGSKKEARSAAFGLSIAVIFVYYVFIRLGEQAGDTGAVAPFLAMWTANVVLGALAVFLLVLNHREAAFDPLDPWHYRRWLPRVSRAPLAAAAARTPGRRAAVVLRIPRLRFPIRFPSLLDRYVARQFLAHLALVAIGFWVIFMLVEFMDLVDDMRQNRVKGAVLVQYFAFHAPAVLHLIFAVAILVTTLTTFGVLSRRNEITAIKAGGISIYRASVPAVGLGLAGSLFLFGLGEFMLPHTNRVAGERLNVIRGRPPRSSSYLDRHWILGADGRFYNYDYLVEGAPSPGILAPPRPGESFALYGLQVYDVDTARWELRDHLRAVRAAWNGVSYDLERGWRRSRQPDGQYLTRSFEGIRTRELEPPSYFRKEEPESDTLDFAALRTHIGVLEALGLDVVKLRVQLHRKLSFPLVSAVMTLIGIPFAFVVGRRGALYGIGLSIVIAIVYWTVLSVFEALGNNALLPPLLAAWAPNLLFAAAGLYLMLTLET